MKETLLHTEQVKALIDKVAGFGSAEGDPRLKKIIARVVTDVMRTIEDFDVTPTEFWAAASYLEKVGQSHEMGLLIPGLGIEHFFDLRMDQDEREAGLTGGTPRTIEGPLYIEGAPLSKGEARLDQGPGDRRGAVHAGSGQGCRRPAGGGRRRRCVARQHRPAGTRISTRRRPRSTCAAGSKPMPTADINSAACCRPATACRRMARPTNCSAPSAATASARRISISSSRPPATASWTTQINIDGDEYLHDDFAFATRDELIPAITHHTDPSEILARGLNEPFATITFDFTMHKDAARLPKAVVDRAHAA